MSSAAASRSTRGCCTPSARRSSSPAIAGFAGASRCQPACRFVRLSRMKNLLAAFSLLALAASADAEVRSVGAFTGIDVAGTMMVTATIGPAKVEVVGDADLVKLVSTTVKNGVLVIQTPRDFPKKKDGKLEVVVSTPELSRVTISGTGMVSVAGLDAKSFAASIPGTGALKLAGTTEKLALVVA